MTYQDYDAHDEAPMSGDEWEEFKQDLIFLIQNWRAARNQAGRVAAASAICDHIGFTAPLHGVKLKNYLDDHYPYEVGIAYHMPLEDLLNLRRKGQEWRERREIQERCRTSKAAYKAEFRRLGGLGDVQAAYALLQKARADHGDIWAANAHFSEFEHIIMNKN